MSLMYKTIKSFSDLEDGGHVYLVGDVYPRAGKSASKERIKELSGRNNKLKAPLIEKVQIEGRKKSEDV